MRIIAEKNLKAYVAKHPTTKGAVSHWFTVSKASEWQTTSEVVRSFPNAKSLGGDRIRFEVGSHRLICGIKFRSGIIFVKFVGTHAEYDSIDDVHSVAMF